MALTADNTILFDWFSITSAIDSVTTIIEKLGLVGIPWQQGRGAHGFKYRYYYNGISIHYERDDELVWLEMSGTGCRAYETYSTCCDWYKLFDIILDDPFNYNLTRLDVAYDDLTDTFDMATMCRYMSRKAVVTKFRDYGIEHRSFCKNDFTLFFGSNKSDVYIRIYNKAAERGREDDIKHWVRFEIQMRDENAFGFIDQLKNNQYDLGSTFIGVVNHYMRFVCESQTESNKSRWKSPVWWTKFIKDSERIKLYTKHEDQYNEAKLQEYVFGQAGQAVKCAMDIYGDDFDLYLNDYLKQHEQSKNPKYDDLRDQLCGTPF